MSDPVTNALRIAAPNDMGGIERSLIEAMRRKAAEGNQNAQAGVAQHDASMANPLWGSSTYLAQQPANTLGEMLQRVPTEAMFLANFTGPGPKASSMPKAKSLRPEPEALPQGRSNGVPSVLAETDRSLLPEQFVGKHPYERAQEVMDALQRAFPNTRFRLVRSGSAAGDSAYIQSPMGELRLSDHFANPRPGQWDASHLGSPREIVASVADKMDQTIQGLLEKKPPQRRPGAPYREHQEELQRFKNARPAWMSKDEWAAFKSSFAADNGNQ